MRAARQAFDDGPWGRMTGTERARLLRRFADLLAENAEALGIIESTDNGKLIREMGAQLKGLPEYYYYFAGAADKIQGATIPSDKPNFFVYTRREPVGVVGGDRPGTRRCCCSASSWRRRSRPAARSWSSRPSRRRRRCWSSGSCLTPRLPAGRVQRRHRLRAERGPRRWCATQGWIRSPSPARPRSASR